MPVAAFSPGEPHDDTVVRLATNAMGTRFEFVLHGEDPVRLRAAGEAAVAEVLSLHRRLSAFDRASEVSRLNREAGAGWARVDRQVFALLALCRRVWRESGGAFDITIGPLMAAWGFRADQGPRDPHAIAAAAARTGFHKIELDPGRERVRYLDPGVQIDLGAVGKGFALDAAAEILREAGVDRGFLHGGTSSCLALTGAEAENPAQAWRVRLGEAADAPVVALTNQALGVSAPNGRTVMSDDGHVLGHVLDPRSSQPSRGVRHAAALAPSAAAADAWSTAALVLGAEAVDGVDRAGAGVSFGVQLENAGTAHWTFQGCWPLGDVDVQQGRRRIHAMAGVT